MCIIMYVYVDKKSTHTHIKRKSAEWWDGITHAIIVKMFVS